MNDRDSRDRLAAAGPAPCFVGDSPMSLQLQGHDWSRSPLGEPDGWPHTVHAAVSLMLDSPVPMWLAWGADMSMLYNTPYAALLGNKHPQAVGAPVARVWSDIWPQIGPLVQSALEGRGVHREDLLLTTDRHGEPRDAWFTFSYSPLRDDAGAVCGMVCTVWETTDKVLAQRRLAESESRLNAFTLASTNVVYRMSPDWGRLLELDGQGFIADTNAPSPDWLEQYIHADDRPVVVAAVADALRSRGRFEVEHRVLRLDGSTGWMLSRAIPVCDELGAVVEWFGTATDIDRRRRAQQALEDDNRSLMRRVEDAVAQQRLFAGIVDSTHAMVQVADRDGRWMAINRAARAGLAGLYGAEPRLGDSVFPAGAGSSTGAAWEAAWRAALRGREYTTLLELDDAAGPRTFEASFHALRDGAGRVSGVYQFAVDVTERLGEQRRLKQAEAALAEAQKRQAEEALRESERQYRALFEAIDEGFCVIEFIDGPEGPLSDYVHVAANPAYAANAGIDGVVGQRVRAMVPAEADAWVETYRQVLITGEPLRFERELERTGRYLELAAFRIDPPERRQVAVLFQDITPRRQAEIALRDLNESLELRVAEELAERLKTEEALRQSQKMEAVGQLTGGIAHDFNNMLAVVIGSLDLLGRRLAEGDARSRRYVDAARDGARRAAQLTQRLLAFSRQQPLRPEPVDANKLVAGMSDLLRHSLGGAVRLETVLSGGLWRTHADPNQLENVILNLAVNGRDAMADGGRLTIETANCHLDDRYAEAHLGLAPGQYVLVAVTDTGAGMPAEVVAKAFDPFFTTKEVGRGTGLGLSQVYGFVKQSGGHVKIYSEPGQGTAVKVYLPRLMAEPKEDTPPEPVRDMPRGDNREVVLVVEDEPAVRQFSVEALAELGYRVLEADGAAAALRLLDAHPEVVLLFTDVVMPEVNGRRLADEALRRRPGLRVLFTTGYTRNAVVHNGVLDAGVHLIGKPFTVEALAEQVRKVLDGPTGTSPA